MSRFPDTATATRNLSEFLAESEAMPAGNELPEGFAATSTELRAKAERLIARLSNPIRVAVAGMPGSGKTSVAAFLSGQVLARPAGAQMPPVMFVFGAKPATVAGWWDGRQIVHDGLGLEETLGATPHFVEVRLPNPVLKDVSFLDLPGLETAQERRDQVTWLSRRADIILWCTNAAKSWTEEDRQLWARIPERLHERSLMMVTHLDLPAIRDRAELIMLHLAAAGSAEFGGVLPIHPPNAIASTPGGVVRNPDGLAASGGKELLRKLLGFAVEARREALTAAIYLLEHKIKPFRTALEVAKSEGAKPAPKADAVSPEVDAIDEVSEQAAPEADKPQADDAPAADPSGPEPAVEAPKAETPPKTKPKPKPKKKAAPTAPEDEGPPLAGTWAQFGDEITKLIDDLNTQNGAPDAAFVRACTDLARSISVWISVKGSLRADAVWLIDEIDEALMQLTLLELEPAETSVPQAANMMLQLGRDLSWALAPASQEDAA